MPTGPITIDINMDQKCKQCGKPGATQSGLCLDCVGKRITGNPSLPPVTPRQEKVLAKISQRVNDLIQERKQAIWQDFKRAYENYEGEGKFKFRIGMSATIEPRGDSDKVKVQIAFGVTETASCEDTIGETEDMFEQP